MNFVLCILLLPAIYLIAQATYDLFFHPLSHFPGPKLWIISRIPYIRSLQRGDFHRVIQDLHKQYGPIVRLNGNELSFIDAQAWQDIYGQYQNRPNFNKNPLWLRPGPNGVHTILSAPDTDHSRMRKLLSYAFSEKALRAQEPLLQSYIDLLIAQLRQKTTLSPSHTAIVDLTQWFNFTTFDITGDLSFGESFHCLEDGTLHPWVAMLFLNLKAVTLAASCRLIPGLEPFLRWLIPRSVMQQRVQHFELARHKVHKRLVAGADPRKLDFMTYVLRHNDAKGMTVPEIESTFAILVIAGSETTATALTGITHYLLQDPASLQALARELRAAFACEVDITIERLAQLDFLNAVVDEGLRLCPPVPFMPPRLVPPEGACVCGYWLPGNTSVSIPHFAAYRSPANFSDPDTFRPDRWGRVRESLVFQPFSYGPRNCVGKNLAYVEMRLVLAKLVWNFDLVPVEEGGEWGDQRTFILWEKRPLRVELRGVER
ncbi:hypothetical protein MMC11_005334 [Xylographa trunciseda]|nr:hypothetical protein [Xylographa trunciseda]